MTPNLTTVFLDGSGVGNTTVITGPTIAGSIINWYLFGVLSVQYLLYLMYSRNDKIMIKVIVHLVFALNTVQTFAMMDDVFFWFVYNFGDANKLLQIRWAFDTPVIDAIVVAIVQVVYCWRIWVLSGWRILPILTCVVSLLAGAAGLACGIRFQVQDSFSLAHGFKGAIMLWLFGTLVTNIVIASSMTYVLLRVRKDSVRVRSSVEKRILRLLVLTLETNALPVAVAIVTVALYLAKPVAPPKTKFYQLGGHLLGKLYSSCLMVLLNQRNAGHYNTNTRVGSSGGTYGSRSGEVGLGSGTAGTSRAVITRTVIVDDGRPTPSKVREFSGEENYKSRISLGV